MQTTFAKTFLLMMLAIHASIINAQEQPLAGASILVIESDRMFTESLFGQRVAADLAQLRADLIVRNAQMEDALTEEEQELTEKRKTMSAAEFSVLAKAFDVKVRGIRAEQDAKFRELNELNERERGVFVQAARPILSELMRETGAALILERRTVLVSSDRVDITQEAIVRLNASLGDGQAVSKP
ncbi:Outer membrane protein (OmpH-like) [Shimia sp. SK013]|uniref:OmpH family outer membrane protein n=1 Tax=Shimia sp. SK013 TaxID=1389006 RepID=UPI0006B62C59|nr:OmpH family outer membrane protein [Shimia sp. SK013]KPA22722.1 Outer membrane protein (OmpH-like) [Shimia sp. SK013]